MTDKEPIRPLVKPDQESYKGWVAALKLLRSSLTLAEDSDEVTDSTIERRAPAQKTTFAPIVGAASEYVVLPRHLAFARPGTSPLPWAWRIEIHGAPHIGAPIGLDLLGSIILGRNASGEEPADLDFMVFGGAELGVSRRHALIQMTASSLYLIDLGSTNGTRFNDSVLKPGTAAPLAYGDRVALGDLGFTIKIIAHPTVPSSIPKSTRPSLGLG